MDSNAVRDEVRDFLASRRARITPGQAGLPVYGSNRRVKGLRREELAMLVGVSVDADLSNLVGDEAKDLLVGRGPLEAAVRPDDVAVKRDAQR